METPIRVVIADDNADMRRIERMMISRAEGFETCEVMCSALWLFARRSTIVSPDAAVLLSAAALLSVAALPPPQAHRLSAVAKLKIAAIVLFILFSLRNFSCANGFCLPFL